MREQEEELKVDGTPYSIQTWFQPPGAPPFSNWSFAINEVLPYQLKKVRHAKTNLKNREEALTMANAWIKTKMRK